LNQKWEEKASHESPSVVFHCFLFFFADITVACRIMAEFPILLGFLWGEFVQLMAFSWMAGKGH
jgi:hypothetical protein